MIYLLDANVLMTAQDNYYPMDTVPQFWDWVIDTAAAGHLKIPHEIYKEITNSTSEIGTWAKDSAVTKALRLEESVNAAHFQTVLDVGYGTGLTDTDFEKMGKDPFLVAYGLTGDRTVVTKEVSKPGKQKGNRKVPDVCNAVGVAWERDFPVFRRLGFKTS